MLIFEEWRITRFLLTKTVAETVPAYLYSPSVGNVVFRKEWQNW
jgi:hypothetical protein